MNVPVLLLLLLAWAWTSAVIGWGAEDGTAADDDDDEAPALWDPEKETEKDLKLREFTLKSSVTNPLLTDR